MRTPRRRRSARALLPLPLLLLLAACGGSGGTSASAVRNGVASGPTPDEMCPSTSESPAVVAYDQRTGAFRWVVCTSADARYTVQRVDDGVARIGRSDGTSPWPAVEGYSLRDGRPVAVVSPPTTWGQHADGPVTLAVVDGVRVTGGQDEPVAAYDDESGELLWTHDGWLAYDDVWAVDDGAVYVIDDRSGPTATLYAYEIRTGATRWSRTLADTGTVYPWLARDGVVFALWTNLALLSAEDGALLWRTAYPAVEFPRMSGVGADGTTVVVTFSTVRSGGD